MEVRDTVAIITGASEGIGLAIARVLACEGAQVVLASRNIGRLKEIEHELPGSFAVQADMRVEDDIRRLVEETITRFGRVDILINNAGQAIYGKIAEIPLEEYRSVIELNILGALAAMQAVIPHMRKARRGAIVNVSSGTSKMVLPGAGAYAATKSALNMLSLVAREELKEYGIVVSTLYPYITVTRLAENAVGGSHRPISVNAPGRPPAHTAEFVAEKTLELLRSEEAELVLIPQRP